LKANVKVTILLTEREFLLNIVWLSVGFDNGLSPMPKTQTRRSSERTVGVSEAEVSAFRQQRTKLMNRYAGQYIAFYGGRVVDHDKDDEALAARLFKKFGDVAFYIVRLEDTPSVSEVPSPELAN
jgi:hypothetical protein